MAGWVSGKVVLLTGGAMGLGKAATRALMAEGATVIITDIDEATGRANSVQPGTILTPNVESVIAGTPDPDTTRAAFSIAQPIGRMGEPDDIAHLVVYLASDESKFATGAPFIVDGGLSIA